MAGLDSLLTVAVTQFGFALLRSVLTVARRAILIALVTLIFVIAAITLLGLSAVVLTGWWQDFTLELGVGLLVAGVVDIAVLGALHGLIEGTGDAEVKIVNKEGQPVNNTIMGVNEVSLEKVLEGYKPFEPSGTGWPV